MLRAEPARAGPALLADKSQRSGTSMVALAHAIEDKAEAAYRRGDLFEKRRKLMEAWAVYCTSPKAGKVIAFRR